MAERNHRARICILVEIIASSDTEGLKDFIVRKVLNDIPSAGVTVYKEYTSRNYQITMISKNLYKLKMVEFDELYLKCQWFEN